MRAETEYFKIFNGGTASLNSIQSESPHLDHTVNMLLKLGRVVGQRTLGLGEAQDTLLFSADRQKMIDERVIFEQ